MSSHRFGLGNVCTQCGTRFHSSAAAGPCSFIRVTPKFGRIAMSISRWKFSEYDEHGRLVKETPCEWFGTILG